jgi:hypothetical protein
MLNSVPGARSDALFEGEVERKSEQLYGDVRLIRITRCSGSGIVGRLAAFPARRGFSGQKVPQELERICAKCPCDGNKFDHIEPSLAAFILGDKGLRDIKRLSQCALANPGLFPRRHQKADEARIVRGCEGLCMLRQGRESAARNLILDPDYPKIGSY